MRATALLLALLPACAPDVPPPLDIPSWAKIAPEQIAEAEKHGVPVAFENDLGMRFVLIPAGTFLMGSPEDEEGREDDEKRNEVTISKPFYMQITEVTNRQYLLFRPSHSTGAYTREIEYNAECPAQIRWRDAVEFVAWASSQDGSRAYLIPTEEEWEYACRAGSDASFWWGESKEEAGRHANVWNRSTHPDLYEFLRSVPDAGGWGPFDTEDGHRELAPVGSFLPNAWGLHDAAGSVREWFRASREGESSGGTGEARVSARGGGYQDNWAWLRSPWRGLGPWDPQRPPPFGLRLVSPLPEEEG